MQLLSFSFTQLENIMFNTTTSNLWKKLNDQPAEKACGGAGIGQANSEDNQLNREIAQDFKPFLISEMRVL